MRLTLQMAGLVAVLLSLDEYERLSARDDPSGRHTGSFVRSTGMTRSKPRTSSEGIRDSSPGHDFSW